MQGNMIPISEVVAKDRAGLGFERVEFIHGATYKDSSTVILVPSRGTIHYRAAAAIESVIAPMNQKRAKFWAVGHEVGHAYNAMLKNILADPQLSTWKYILTLEDDNIPPPDAHVRLLESIESTGFDAISGIYFTKGDFNMPMAYGDPEAFRRGEPLEFRPRSTADALKAGQIMEVNGIAMGCALWRMDLFREVPAPWFVSVADLIPEKGVQCFTQDLYFCQRARQAGKRFGVDMRVRVGHLDINSGIVY